MYKFVPGANWQNKFWEFTETNNFSRESKANGVKKQSIPRQPDLNFLISSIKSIN